MDPTVSQYRDGYADGIAAERARIRRELLNLAGNWRMAGQLRDRDAPPSGEEVDLRAALDRICPEVD